MYDEAKVASLSEDIKSKLLSGDANLRKSASLAADEYFRTEIRENGIRRQITPPVQVTRENFDKTDTTDIPIMYVDIANKSAGAVQVSFEAGPSNEIIHARRARVEFNRIMTKKYGIDKIRLETYSMPLLDILYDLMLKDIMDVEDAKAISCDNAILGTIDTNNAALGCRRYIHVGPVSRAAVSASLKGMPKVKGHLQTAKFVMNQCTFTDFMQLDRLAIGGDAAQDILFNGFTESKLGGVPVIVTTKDYLIPDNKVYIYTEPKYYGGFYTYKDVSMVTDEQDDIWLNFFAHEVIGFTIVNAAGVAAVQYDGTYTGWANQ